MAKKKPIVIMLGVHRSGTSLAANIFHETGLYLGNQLIPGHRDNPKGFWEHGGIVEETREIENELGINPFRGREIFPPDGKWWNNGSIKPRFENLKKCIQNEISHQNIFGFKDPRTLLMLPMWQKLFNQLSLQPRYVLLIRHPKAVAASMKKRNGLRLKHGEFIWRNHLSYGLSQLKEPPIALVQYERWQKDLRKQVAAMADAIDKKPEELNDIIEKAKTHIDPGLTTFESQHIKLSLDPETVLLYDLLIKNNIKTCWNEIQDQCKTIVNNNRRFSDIYESIANRAGKLEIRLEENVREVVRLKEKVSLLSQELCEPNGKTQHSVEWVEPRPRAPYEAEFPDLTQFINKVNQPGRKLRVCIAAEDIVGPVRNGGIGTTYTHLSKMLAKAEHEVVIAYLRGNHCQNKSMPYWINWYKSFGVTFIPIDPDQTDLEIAAPQWMRPMYALYEFLKQKHFDLVHVSEWRGSAYLSLLAKKQGLAFHNTVFCVKASSPWLWNREYGFHTIGRQDDLPKMHAEKCSIELADLVIGGSRYLLCWMLEHGYTLPEGRCYVQPNVVFPLDLDALANPRRKMAGGRMAIDEIVFFGRLEYRKGLDIFFKALDRLVSHQIPLPKITVMGKYGERIPTHAELSIPEYIRMRSRRLSKKVKILHNFGNEEALRYLLTGNRLAVMPSRIENSTLTVYETCYYGIPCIASDVGGTVELIAAEHHDKVLTAPDPIALSKKINKALSEGGFIPKPSFRNDRNLATWLKFHGAMGAYVNGLQQTTAEAAAPALPKLSICIVVSDDHEYAQEVLSRIADKIDGIGAEVIVVNSESTRAESIAWIDQLKDEASKAITVTENHGYGEQQAWNHAAVLATGEVLVFMETGSLLKPDAIDTLKHASAVSDAAVFGCYFDRVRQIEDIDTGRSQRQGVLTGDYSSAFFDMGSSSPLIAVRKQVFEALNGFRDDFEIPGAASEFVSNARLHNYKVEAIPESLVWFVDAYASNKWLNQKASAFRSIRPFLESAPHCYKKILMAAKNFGAGISLTSTADGASVISGGGGTMSDPVLSLEEKARRAAHQSGGSPAMRNLAWKIYHLNIRIFRMLISFQISVFNKMIAIKKKLSKK